MQLMLLKYIHLPRCPVYDTGDAIEIHTFTGLQRNIDTFDAVEMHLYIHLQACTETAANTRFNNCIRVCICMCFYTCVSSYGTGDAFEYIYLQPYKDITKTRLFKCIENFSSKNLKFSDKKKLIFFIFLLKT